MDLSDNGDDFDNFFSNHKSKTSAQKAQQKTSKISDPMDDLFGLDEKAETRAPATRKLGVAAAVTKPRIEEQPKEDDDDDLGFDPRKPKGLGKSQNLFDDLLTPLETKRPQTAGAGATKPPMSRQSTDTTTDTSNIFQAQASRPKTSQGRRTSNMSNVQNPDPLGLFTKDKDSSKPASRITSPKSQKKRGTTADWLGLAVEPETETTKPEPIAETPKSAKLSKASSKESAEILKIPETTEHYEDSGDEILNMEQQHKEDKKNVETNVPYMIDATSHNILLMNNLNMDAKQSVTALKYQEQQLMMASQMKQQERVLLDMQRKQDSLLQHQERQFQTLFQQQMHRHQQLEELIKQQQQRINTHLQLMMTQPPLQLQSTEDFNLTENVSTRKENTSTGKEHTNETVEEENSTRELLKDKQNVMELLQYESDNKRLELENLRLEELIANTKSNYEKEIELLEKSYK